MSNIQKDSDTLILSVCITTRNRPNELLKCLNSLTKLNGINFEVIVGDDASDELIFPQIIDAIDLSIFEKTYLIRFEENIGLIATRNKLAKLANAQYILSLDDDTILHNPDVIYKGIKVLYSDNNIGAIALTQSGKGGSLLPKNNQPSPVDYACLVPAYNGFGHIVRRDLFLSLDGYRSIFWYGYEESEFSIRMLDKGFNVLFLPGISIIHYHSPIGRNKLEIPRYFRRNKCFSAIYNEPLLMMIISIPLRFIYYTLCQREKVYKEFNIFDKGGIRWLAKEILDNFSIIWKERKPLKWSTCFRWQWRKIQRNHPEEYKID